MIFNNLKTYSLIFLTSLISACIAQPQSSQLIGSCKQLKKDHKLFEGRAGTYSGDKILAVSDNVQIGRMKEKGTILSGTKVKINSIIKDSDGSYGQFLRVQIEISDGPYSGVKADVPACVPYHPSQKWVRNCTLDPNKLIFNANLVIPCKISEILGIRLSL